MKRCFFIFVLALFVLLMHTSLSYPATRDYIGKLIVPQSLDESLLTKSEKIEVLVKIKDGNRMASVFSTSKFSNRANVRAFTESRMKQINARIVYRFSTMDAYLVEISPKDLHTLASEDFVEYVELPRQVRAFLTESVPLINATDVWNFQINGINVTGNNVAVCVIDTGVDYTHPDLGNCTLSDNTIVDGAVYSYDLSSAHPYDNSITINYTIQNTSFTKIGVHFSRISTEPGYDFVRVYDASGTLLAEYSGEYRDVWTPSANGSEIIISLKTDDNVTGYGFDIDRIINGTAVTQFTWKNCKKVVYGYDIAHNDPDPMDEWNPSDDGTIYDDDGHGTHVSGIIGANGTLKGIAPNVRLVVAKVFDYWSTATTNDILQGIDWCINQSENYNISVISMSLGTSSLYSDYCDSEYPSLSQVINNAVARNISVVVATGNDGSYNSISAPACIYNATRVTATYKNDSLAWFANRASAFPDIIAAPGVDINSTYLDGTYYVMSGTSMATPHVSGAIALLVEAYKKLYNVTPTPQFLKQLLNDTGKQIFDPLGGLNLSRINMYYAFMYVYPFNFIFPKEGVYYTNKSSIIINVSIHDLLANISAVILKFDNINYTMIKEGSGNNITSYYNFTNLSDGTYSYYVFFNDTANRTYRSMNKLLVIDTMAPSINFSSPTPANNTLTRNNTIVVNLSSYDLNPGSIIFYWNGTQEVYSWVTSYFILIINKTNLSDGNYTFYAVAYDKANNKNISEVRIIRVDATPPALILRSPQNTTYDTINLTINFSAIDNTGIDVCWYIYNDTTNLLLNCSNATFVASNNTRSTLTICANDTLGNERCVNTTFTVDTLQPFVFLLSPKNNMRYNFANINLSFVVKDNLAVNLSCTISTKNETYELYRQDIAASNDTQINLNVGVGDGDINITIVCADSANNTGFNSTFIVVDSKPPSIQLNINNNTYLNTRNLTLNITLVDAHKFNGTVIVGNTTVILNNTNPWYNATYSFDEGVHNISIFARDDFNNTVKRVFIFWIDLTPPSVSRFEITRSEIYIGDVLSVSDFVCEAQDSLSGIKSKIVTWEDTTSYGEKEARCVVYDWAGNLGVKLLKFYVRPRPSVSSETLYSEYSLRKNETPFITMNETRDGMILEIKNTVSKLNLSFRSEILPIRMMKLEFSVPFKGTIEIRRIDLKGSEIELNNRSYVVIDGFEVDIDQYGLNEAELFLVINKSRVSAEALNLSTLKLVKTNGSAREVYPASLVNETGEEYIFRVVVKSFSRFLLVAERVQKAAVEGRNNSGLLNENRALKPSLQRDRTEAGADLSRDSVPVLIIVSLIILIILALASISIKIWRSRMMFELISRIRERLLYDSDESAFVARIERRLKKLRRSFEED